jgi:hypothetical protein
MRKQIHVCNNCGARIRTQVQKAAVGGDSRNLCYACDPELESH